MTPKMKGNERAEWEGHGEGGAMASTDLQGAGAPLRFVIPKPTDPVSNQNLNHHQGRNWGKRTTKKPHSLFSEVIDVEGGGWRWDSHLQINTAKLKQIIKSKYWAEWLYTHSSQSTTANCSWTLKTNTHCLGGGAELAIGLAIGLANRHRCFRCQLECLRTYRAVGVPQWAMPVPRRMLNSGQFFFFAVCAVRQF